MHRKHAQHEILAKRFTPIQFINYLVENRGTKFFSQINTSENHELCIECSTPRIGSSWGYMHAGTIHSPVCTSCKTNSQNGDPYPICAEDIEAILQVRDDLVIISTIQAH